MELSGKLNKILVDLAVKQTFLWIKLLPYTFPLRNNLTDTEQKMSGVNEMNRALGHLCAHIC